MYMHHPSLFYNKFKSICDEKRTRACRLPAPTSNSRSISAAGSSEIKEPLVLEECQKVKGACAGVAMKACGRRQQLT